MATPDEMSPELYRAFADLRVYGEKLFHLCFIRKAADNEEIELTYDTIQLLVGQINKARNRLDEIFADLSKEKKESPFGIQLNGLHELR